jgi:hypothetical protein
MPFDTEFRWNEWNLDHSTSHGVEVSEIEHVVRNAGHGYPTYIGNGKWRVIGRGQGGRMVEVVFVDDPGDPTIYVIHAQPVKVRRRK